MAKYYGKKEIADIVEDDSLTSDSERKKGYTNVKLIFKNGDEEVIRQKMVSLAVTNEPLKEDLTELREKRCLPIAARIMEVLLEYDIKPHDPMAELDFIIRVLQTVHKSNMDGAIEAVWGIKKADLKYSDVHAALIKKEDGQA